MGVQISQHKGVGGKFVDGLIVGHLGIIADVAGGIGKPVCVPLIGQLQQLPNHGEKLPVEYIVHISRQGYRSPGQYAAQRRQGAASRLPDPLPAVRQHLAHQGEGQGEGKGRHHGPHEIVGLLDPGKGEPG